MVNLNIYDVLRQVFTHALNKVYHFLFLEQKWKISNFYNQYENFMHLSCTENLYSNLKLIISSFQNSLPTIKFASYFVT